MRVSKKDADVILNAIDQWEEEQVIDAQNATQLRKSVNVYKDDLGSLTFYAFVAAVSCAILAFGAIVLDEKWIERMRRFFAFSEVLIGGIFLILSVLLIGFAGKRKRKFPDATLSNESFNILAVLSLGVSITYLTRGLGEGYRFYGLVVLVLALSYGAVAVYLRSKLIWICALLALIVSWGIQTWTWSGPAHDYFLGMNYPLRMTVLGGVLLAVVLFLRRQQWQKVPFYEITVYFLWIFFLLSGLFLSVSGNLSYDVWSNIRQGRLLPWALGYTLLLGGLIVLAYKLKDEIFRDLVLLFFLLNIYTRYFEYFWDKTNKGIFFALLALSFWLIGRKTEQMRKRFS
ncbi:hypothetical protein [Niabella drilacis]|uniref:DUF2157 domain-containing protein n=1 Tax=Niabella drilacis (strain DSM 25811 / CCM 8410 / CCUG 62505 / LMG 26954 / E90) TaxID=1285928 RepID=A0A1G6KXZ2_NIADE|nr:hypothetical protein [Niabella drilacis]SDC35950.1 hypothetical protein SAMN04487894_102147 [Niabella drilacis]